MPLDGSVRTQTYFRLSLLSTWKIFEFPGGEKRRPEIRLCSLASWTAARSKKQTVSRSGFRYPAWKNHCSQSKFCKAKAKKLCENQFLFQKCRSIRKTFQVQSLETTPFSLQSFPKLPFLHSYGLSPQKFYSSLKNLLQWPWLNFSMARLR